MTDLQRAFISALVYVYKNEKFSNYKRIGVARLPTYAKKYAFSGEWNKDSIETRSEEEKAMINSIDIYAEPGGYKIEWTERSTVYIEIHMQKGLGFHGRDGDNFKFEGRLSSSTTVDVRDYSQDKDKYVYRVTY